MDPESAPGPDPQQPVAREEANSLHQQRERRPFPTDSMVTVRLSETSIPPVADASDIIIPKPPFCNAFRESKGMEYISENSPQNEEPSSNTNASFEMTEESESIIASINNAEEQQNGTRRSNPRSESKSRSSFSSISSAQFDWDELDKSEEQVLRDEESDEVCRRSDALCW